MNDFRTECDAIRAEIEKISEKVIIDGVIDADTYLNTRPRILWVLKEANSNEQWSYTDLLCVDNKQWKAGLGITLRRVIYTSYGILNGFPHYRDMPGIHTQEVFDAAKHIAYINIKKTGGGASVADSVIRQAYEQNKELIQRQIKAYAPNILIFGNTMKYMFDDLGIAESDKSYADENTSNTTYYIKGDQLFIHAWHPAYINKGDAVFCDEIISVVHNYWENRRKQPELSI